MWQDVRYAFRMMVRNRAFTLAVLITLMLGIGANTALFSVVDAVLLRALPYPDADRIAVVWERAPERGINRQLVSPRNFVDWQARNHVFEKMAFSPAWTGSRDVTILFPSGPKHVAGAYVSSKWFDVLRVRTALGEAFIADDDRREGRRVVIISNRLWHAEFGGDRRVLGQAITVDTYARRTFEITGVMPPGFDFPGHTDLWLPAGWMGVGMEQRVAPWFEVIARLRPGVSIDAAQAGLAALQRDIAMEHGDTRVSTSVLAVRLPDEVSGSSRPTLLMLFATVGIVLMIACTNTANLLLVRATTAERDMAIRSALGAHRHRLVRQVLTECTILAFAAGALAVVFATWGVYLMRTFGPSDMPRLNQAVVDRRVLSFAFGVSLITAVLFGLVPALQISRSAPADKLTSSTRRATAASRVTRSRQVLVALETAMAVILLVIAGLLVRSLISLERVDLGFRCAGIISAYLDLSSSRFTSSREASAKRPQVFTRNLIDRLRALPSVTAAAAANGIPPSAGSLGQSFAIERTAYSSAASYPSATVRAVTPSYFATLGIPLKNGRAFTDSDDELHEPVVIINETLARSCFGTEARAIGSRIDIAARERLERDGARFSPMWHTVIGIAKDVKDSGLTNATGPEIYKPDLQWAWHWAHLLIRSDGKADTIAPSLRKIVAQLDEEQSVTDIVPLNDVIAREKRQPRFRTALLSGFATVAVFLAAIGVYGVLSYAVSQRTAEIGIRLALGAAASDMHRVVLGGALQSVGAGLVLGITAAAIVSRLLSPLLFNTRPLDLLTYTAVVGTVCTVAAAATWIPARRISRMDPIQTLRYE